VRLRRVFLLVTLLQAQLRETRLKVRLGCQALLMTQPLSPPVLGAYLGYWFLLAFGRTSTACRIDYLGYLGSSNISLNHPIWSRGIVTPQSSSQ